MVKPLRLPLMVSAIAFAGAAGAAPFSPTFSDYAFPGTQFTIDAAANAFFSSEYGISISNAYLYLDVRDTFDGVGIANGEVADLSLSTPQSARIDFLDQTDFVTIDYAALSASTYSAYSSDGSLLASRAVTGDAAAGENGTFAVNSVGTTYISYVTFSGIGGQTAISNLRYNYDGVTGGGNVDIHPPIPEPETYALMAMGLVLVGFATRNRRRQAPAPTLALA